MKIWIVEDDAGYRRNLKRSMENEERISECRVFPSCIEFLDALSPETQPDLVLMDLGLPAMSGLEGISQLVQVAPEVSIIVLTVHEGKDQVLKALEAGAAGYLLKSSSTRQIVNSLASVIDGGAALSPEIARVVLDQLQKQEPTRSQDFQLSSRELEVLHLLAEGMLIKEIAAKLNISRATAAFHLGNIYQKLDVKSQSGAVAKALREKII